MSLILVASQNPVKLTATQTGFSAMFPGANFEFRGISVASGVSAQPMTRAETFEGALNRANNALEKVPDAGYAPGIEEGIEEVDGRFEVFAWVVVLHDGKIGRARTGVFICRMKSRNSFVRGMNPVMRMILFSDGATANRQAGVSVYSQMMLSPVAPIINRLLSWH